MVRAYFNEGQVVRLLHEGQLIADPEPPGAPDPARLLPNGTESYTVWVKHPDGRRLYRTHCYVCPHRLLLGNGFLDPKDMYLATEILTNEKRHKDNDTCLSCGMWKPRADQALAQLAAYRKRCPTCP